MSLCYDHCETLLLLKFVILAICDNLIFNMNLLCMFIILSLIIIIIIMVIFKCYFSGELIALT